MFQSFNHINPINHGSDNFATIQAHGGEIKVETNEGDWAMFIVKLPNV